MDEYQLMQSIAERASAKNLMQSDQVSLIMDLSVAHESYNLRLNELLNADNFNFSHDIVGIQQNIDRVNSKMLGRFIPRYASHSME